MGQLESELPGPEERDGRFANEEDSDWERDWEDEMDEGDDVEKWMMEDWKEKLREGENEGWEASTNTLYKTVDKKVRPVSTNLPTGMQPKMIRPDDLLDDLPMVPIHPGPYRAGKRMTASRLDAMLKTVDPSCSETERRMVAHVLVENEEAFAWTEEEKGHFREDLIPPYVNPMVDHVPWADRPLKLAHAAIETVVALVKEKIAAGVYERSQASYRSRFFLVSKKESGTSRIVHDLQKYNSFTIKDAGLPPSIEQFVQGFGGRACIGVLDLMDGYGQRALAEQSRDATTFATPIGLLRLKTLPQGATNSVADFQRTVSFILEEEMPDPVDIFVDDVGIKGPKTKYEDPITLQPEVLEENNEVRRYVYEHLCNLNRVLYRMRKYGGTFKGGKCLPMAAEATLVGYRCSYDGTRISESALAKIETWPTPENRTDVRSFLGTVTQARNWVQDFSILAGPLRRLTQKAVDFEWTAKEQTSMDMIKERIAQSSFLVNLDYTSDKPIVMAVDSSARAVGYSLGQDDADGKRRIARYGSLVLNEREGRYSQAKLELYGLLKALKKNHVYLWGRKFVVELDAAYVKGMLNSPELPNSAMTRWLWAIKLYDFDIVHVPAAKHAAVDGLSRRKRAPEDESEDEGAEEWLDYFVGGTRVVGSDEYWVDEMEEERRIEELDEEKYAEEPEWGRIGDYLQTLRCPEDYNPEQRNRLHKKAFGFFLKDGRIWKKGGEMPREVIAQEERRKEILRAGHDEQGHKGHRSTYLRIAARFYWRNMTEYVSNYVRTCEDCQHRDLRRYEEPIRPTFPNALFSKVSIDLVSMPKAGGFVAIVLARDDFTGWVEARALRDKGAKAVAAFFFENIISRGVIPAQVTSDNGGEFQAEFASLLKKYGVPHVMISQYHPQANGMLERGNKPFKEAIFRTCRNRINRWPGLVPYAAWADRTTVKRTTGYSPYRMVFGVEPVMPLDWIESTWLVAGWRAEMSLEEMMSLRIRQLEKKKEDNEKAMERLMKAREKSADDHNERFKSSQLAAKKHKIQKGDLVLVHNTRYDNQHGNKEADYYVGPYVVVRVSRQARAYRVREPFGVEIPGTVAHTRIRPYFTRPDRDEDLLSDAQRSNDEESVEEDEEPTALAPFEEEEETPRQSRSQAKERREEKKVRFEGGRVSPEMYIDPPTLAELNDEDLRKRAAAKADRKQTKTNGTEGGRVTTEESRSRATKKREPKGAESDNTGPQERGSSESDQAEDKHRRHQTRRPVARVGRRDNDPGEDGQTRPRTRQLARRGRPL